jgi:general secretion pathway protein K
MRRREVMTHKHRFSTGTKTNPSDQGFALVLIIFVTALLALLAIGLSVALRSHVRLTASTVRTAKAEAAADAGVQLAVLSLVAGTHTREGRRFPVNGQPSSCAFGTATVLTLRIQDASGRVSLNLASDRLLMALFIGLGANHDDASRAADLIIDYRDADSTRRPNGAEAPEYEAATRPGPKNGPFDTVEELGRVLGLDGALLAAATPYLTVHSQTAGVDTRTISSELRRILLRGTEQLPARPSATANAVSGLPTEFLTGSPERVFHVESESHLADGSVYVRQAVVELQSTRTSIPVFKTWSRGERGSASARRLADLPPC